MNSSLVNPLFGRSGITIPSLSMYAFTLSLNSLDWAFKSAIASEFANLKALIAALLSSFVAAVV